MLLWWWGQEENLDSIWCSVVWGRWGAWEFPGLCCEEELLKCQPLCFPSQTHTLWGKTITGDKFHGSQCVQLVFVHQTWLKKLSGDEVCYVYYLDASCNFYVSSIAGFEYSFFLLYCFNYYYFLNLLTHPLLLFLEDSLQEEISSP